jgi:hypothetical protein
MQPKRDWTFPVILSEAKDRIDAGAKFSAGFFALLRMTASVAARLSCILCFSW